MSFPFPLLLLGTYTRKLTQKSSSCLSCFLAQLKPTIHWTRASQPVPAAHTTYRYTCFQFLKILASSTCTRLHSYYGPTCECVQLTIRFENTCKQSKALGDWQANVSQLVMLYQLYVIYCSPKTSIVHPWVQATISTRVGTAMSHQL